MKFSFGQPGKLRVSRETHKGWRLFHVNRFLRALLADALF